MHDQVSRGSAQREQQQHNNQKYNKNDCQKYGKHGCQNTARTATNAKEIISRPISDVRI